MFILLLVASWLAVADGTPPNMRPVQPAPASVVYLAPPAPPADVDLRYAFRAFIDVPKTPSSWERYDR